MMGGKIGIKLANNTFYGILVASKQNKKTLELELTDTGKQAVQIDVCYLSSKDSMHTLTSISLENLVPSQRRTHTVIFSLALDENRNLHCTVKDKNSGARSTVQISFFDFLKNHQPVAVTSTKKNSITPLKYTYTGLNSSEVEAILSDCHVPSFLSQNRMPFLSVAASCICVLVSVFTLFFALNQNKKTVQIAKTDQIPIIAANEDTVLQSNFTDQFQFSKLMSDSADSKKGAFLPLNLQANEKKGATENRSVDASNKKNWLLQPLENQIVVSEYTNIVPQKPVVAAENLSDYRYKVFWGDTLWDIASAYYKNPWLYKQIADYNAIKNTDYIIAGKWIIIPAK